VTNWRDLTPEQRRAHSEKARATRLARKERALARAREADDARIEEPEVAKPVKLAAAAEDVFDGLLTDEEKAEIDRASDKRAREDQRKKIKAAYVKESLARAQREIGTAPPDEEWKAYNEEMCRIYVDMPRMRKPDGKGEHDPEPIIIDQTMYASGRFYAVSRGTAVYINWLMDQARRHVNQVDGRSRTYFNQASGQMVFMGGTAQGGGSLGTSFDALHKRPENE
jgi:hypothetical protein